MLATIFATVVGGLLLAGIVAGFRSHWLYLIVPRLYLHTPLSSGQVVSLTLLNAGLTAEEDVAIRLKGTCKYELLAASKSTVTFTTNTIALPRLTRFESVNVLLLVEGKTFDQSDIETVESKLASGKIVEKKEKAAPLWQHLILWPILALLLGIPFSMGTTLGKEWGHSFVDYLGAQLEWLGPSKQLAGYKTTIVEEKYPYLTTPLSKALADGRIKVSIDEIVRHDDIVNIDLTIANATGQTLVVTIDVKSSAGERGPLDWRDTRIDNIYIANADKKTRRLKAFLPESTSPRALEIEYTFESGHDRHTARQTITF